MAALLKYLSASLSLRPTITGGAVLPPPQLQPGADVAPAGDGQMFIEGRVI